MPSACRLSPETLFHTLSPAWFATRSNGFICVILPSRLITRCADALDAGFLNHSTAVLPPSAV
jgi:hypothetical protein